MSSQEHKIGAHTYLFERLNLFHASDVARIWSYALIMLSKAPTDLKAEDFAKSFPTFLSFVPKPENDYAMNLCLGSVKRSLGGDRGWAPVVGPNGQMMYNDISLPQLYQLIFHSLKTNELINFFGDPLAPLETGGSPLTS